jgi:hypothetical protein
MIGGRNIDKWGIKHIIICWFRIIQMEMEYIAESLNRNESEVSENL